MRLPRSRPSAERANRHAIMLLAPLAASVGFGTADHWLTGSLAAALGATAVAGAYALASRRWPPGPSFAGAAAVLFGALALGTDGTGGLGEDMVTRGLVTLVGLYAVWLALTHFVGVDGQDDEATEPDPAGSA